MRGSVASKAASIKSSSLAVNSGPSKPKRVARRRKISVFGRLSPTGGITAAGALDIGLAVGRVNIVVLEMGAGRQDYIGVLHAVGHGDFDAHDKEVSMG